MLKFEIIAHQIWVDIAAWIATRELSASCHGNARKFYEILNEHGGTGVFFWNLFMPCQLSGRTSLCLDRLIDLDLLVTSCGPHWCSTRLRGQRCRGQGHFELCLMAWEGSPGHRLLWMLGCQQRRGWFVQKIRLSDLTPWIHYNNLQAGEVCLLVTSSLNDRWMWSLWCGELSGSKVFKFKWVESASM